MIFSRRGAESAEAFSANFASLREMFLGSKIVIKVIRDGLRAQAL
jgi:hypothetical protein